MADLFDQVVKASGEVVASRIRIAEADLVVYRLMTEMFDAGHPRFNEALRVVFDAGINRQALAEALQINDATLYRRLADPSIPPPKRALPRTVVDGVAHDIPPAVAARLRELQPLASKLRNHPPGHPFRVARDELMEILSALRQCGATVRQMSEVLGVSDAMIAQRRNNRRMVAVEDADAILARYK